MTLVPAWHDSVGMPQQHLLMQRTSAQSALTKSAMPCLLIAGVVHGGKFYLPMPAVNADEDMRVYDFINQEWELLPLAVRPRGYEAQLLVAHEDTLLQFGGTHEHAVICQP